MTWVASYGIGSLGLGLPRLSGTLGTIAFVLSILAAVAVAFFLAPDSKRESFKGNKVLETVNDILNFRTLLIDKILKFLYIFVTCYLIVSGFFMLFVKGGFVTGLITMIIGPIVARIVFELLMLAIVLVRNVIQINKKMGPLPKDTDEDSIL